MFQGKGGAIPESMNPVNCSNKYKHDVHDLLGTRN